MAAINKKMNIIALFSLISYVSCATPKGQEVNSDFRIIGGKAAKVSEFPAQVSLQNRHFSHLCGGVLIDARHVLTAAHCLEPQKPVIYVMGDDLWISIYGTDTRQIRRILNFIQHPDYSEASMDNDIAVIRLDKPFNVNERFKPMRRSEFTPPVGTHCHVVGWGNTLDENLGGQLSQKLLKAEIRVVDINFCNSSSSYNGGMRPTMICAGLTLGGGHDACQGDSGGLLTCGGIISGVVSSGAGCGRPKYPGIYTDVSLFNVWIDSILSRKHLPLYGSSTIQQLEEIESLTEDNSNANRLHITMTTLFIFIIVTSIFGSASF